MKTSAAIVIASLCLVVTAGARAQDVTEVSAATSVVKVDNPYVRVVEAAIKPGVSEPMHTHPAGWYYVSQGGTLDVEFADGRRETWAPKTGESGWAEAEGPHVSRNTGDTTLVWTLVEAKGAARAGERKRRISLLIPGRHH